MGAKYPECEFVDFSNSSTKKKINKKVPKATRKRQGSEKVGIGCVSPGNAFYQRGLASLRAEPRKELCFQWQGNWLFSKQLRENSNFVAAIATRVEAIAIRLEAIAIKSYIASEELL